MKVSDEILIQKTLDGDKSSFEILVDRYKRSVFLQSIKTTRNFHDAQDITQDVFVEAYFKLQNLREPVKFGRWLRGITQNFCRRWMRKKQMLSDLEIPLDNLQTEVINQWLIEQENSEIWEFGMDIATKLSDDQKSLLKLFYLDNCSCREIAQQMGASEVAIRQRLSRTRQQLKNDLLEGEKDTNGMIAISAICTSILDNVLYASAGKRRYDFSTENRKVIYVRVLKGTQAFDLEFFDEQPYPVQTQRWYRLKLSAIGNQFRYYIDDVLQKEFTFAGYESGGVLMAAGGCVAHFDNVVISGPEIPNGGPGLSPVQLRSKLTTTWGHIKSR